MLDKTFYLVKKNNKSDIVHDRNHTQGYVNMGILYVNSSESIQDIGSSSILYFLYFSYFQIDIEHVRTCSEIKNTRNTLCILRVFTHIIH